MPGAEHRRREQVQRAAQVRHRQALVDRKPLDLVEDRRVGGVERLLPVDPAGRDDVARCAAVQQRPDLHRRGVGAQQDTRRSAGRATACPGSRGPDAHGGMFSASKLSHSASTSGPSATSQPIPTKTSATRSWIKRQRVPATGRLPVPGQRDVDRLLDQHPLVTLGLELRPAARRTPPGSRSQRVVDPTAGVGPGLRRQRTELAARQRDRRPDGPRCAVCAAASASRSPAASEGGARRRRRRRRARRRTARPLPWGRSESLGPDMGAAFREPRNGRV